MIFVCIYRLFCIYSYELCHQGYKWWPLQEHDVVRGWSCLWNRILTMAISNHRSVCIASWAGFSASGLPRNCCQPWSEKSVCALHSAGHWWQLNSKSNTDLKASQKSDGTPPPAPYDEKYFFPVQRIWEQSMRRALRGSRGFTSRSFGQRVVWVVDRW